MTVQGDPNKMKNIKTILSAAFLLIVNYLSFGQNGFTNKEEAKNETINGLKQGKWIEYYDKYRLPITKENFKFYRLTIYKNDKPQEIQREYDSNGKLCTEMQFCFPPPFYTN